MSISLSKRSRLVKPFLAMEVMERAKVLEAEGRNIIYLCLGEPDFPTPPAVLAETGQALAEGATSYTHSLGLLELRQEICRHYRDYYGVVISPDQVLVSSGTSPLLLLLFSALLDDGDELILTDPCYACYPGVVEFTGGKPVLLRTAAADGFQPRPEQVRELMSERTRGLLINSPSNPAGSVLSGQQMQALADLSLPIISDEIYHGLTYEGEEHSILEFTDNAFVLGGFSKAFSMTGWRLGYLIAPPECMRTLQTLHQNFFICANHFVQRAAVAALRQCGDEVVEMRAVYDKRRLELVGRLRDMGLGVHFVPKGAFYVLADARHIDGDSQRLALDILENTGVAVTPGVDFGSGAEGFLRFSYTRPLNEIVEALERIDRYLKKRRS